MCSVILEPRVVRDQLVLEISDTMTAQQLCTSFLLCSNVGMVFQYGLNDL